MSLKALRRRYRLPRCRARRLHGRPGPRRRRGRRRRRQDRAARRGEGAVLRARPARACSSGPWPPAACGSAPTTPSLADRDVHFVCVGTPQRKGENAADLTYVDSAFGEPGQAPVVGDARRRQVDRAGGHRGPPAGHAARDRPGRRRRHAGLEPGVPARGLRGEGHAAPRPPGLRRGGRRGRRAGHRAARRGVRDDDLRRHAAAGHRLPHRRAW
nr:hypothetical protein [Angustibacter aerolatus]